eukprot:15455124-Alexandrium_andersonii.AAC.1
MVTTKRADGARRRRFSGGVGKTQWEQSDRPGVPTYDYCCCTHRRGLPRAVQPAIRPHGLSGPRDIQGRACPDRPDHLASS